MITIVYIKSPDVVGMSATGHAGAAPKGHDIVCAAVSGIIESLRLYLSGLPYCIVRDEDGILTMAATVVRESAFDAAAVGLMALAEQYPDNISFVLKSPFGTI